MANLTIYYQNCRGLRTKTTSFYRNVSLNNYDIILLTETWLLDGLLDSELFDDRYLVFRADRNYARTGQKKGGGVALAVLRKYPVTHNPNWHSSAEDIWVTVELRNSKHLVKLNICVLYLCEQKRGYSFYDQLNNFCNKLSTVVDTLPDEKFLVVGDFNMSDIQWLHSDLGLQPSNVVDPRKLEFINHLNHCNLRQFNVNKNSFDGILDLVLCNEFVSVSLCPYPLTLEDPYHPSLIILPSFVELHALAIPKRTVFCYSRADYDTICKHLTEVDWKTILNEGSIDDAIDYFYSTLYKLRDQFIPTRVVKNGKYPPWYNIPLIKTIKEKHKYLSKFKIYGNKSDIDTFKLFRERVKTAEASCYKDYLIKIEKLIHSNPKMFWSFIKSKRSTSTYPATMIYLDQSSDTGPGICNLFSNYFRTTFLDPDPVPSYCATQNNSPCAMSSLVISDNNVFKLLKSLDLNKSAGPDTIPAQFLVNCAKELSSPVTLLFQRSLREGIVPDIWKRAYITPIHKKGPKNDIQNYRPISKLCLLAKILERLVFNQLYSNIKCTFIPQQHGFLKGRSTVSNLVTLNEYLTSNMENGFQIDVVYTDYSKAFDRIDHNILLSKLHLLGIHGDLYRWFSSYVDNRCQAVVLGGYSSYWVKIPSGVPQGSLLGPLLFSIFINDIDSCLLNSHFLLFADDMKIFKSIHSFAAAQLLQEDLCRLDNYCRLNKLDLNVSKCFCISFSRKRNVIEYNYKCKNEVLSRVLFCRDLGVIHDSKLLFDKHIYSIVDKAYKALGFIIRCSKDFRNMKTIKVLYCAFVRSHLEYASQIWSPCYDIYISHIEKIQRKFTRFLSYKFNIPKLEYPSRCSKFHLLPLHVRRDIADITLLMKIAQGIVDGPELLGNIKLNVPIRSLRKPALFSVPSCRTQYRRNSFLPRSMRQLNNIYPNSSLDVFVTSPRNAKNLLVREVYS